MEVVKMSAAGLEVEVLEDGTIAIRRAPPRCVNVSTPEAYGVNLEEVPWGGEMPLISHPRLSVIPGGDGEVLVRVDRRAVLSIEPSQARLLALHLAEAAQQLDPPAKTAPGPDDRGDA